MFILTLLNFMKKILIFGGSGFIGKILEKYFLQNGYQVTIASRSPNKMQIFCNFLTPVYNIKEFEGFDVWINLAGETISGLRWTKRKKQKILFSRINYNRFIRSLAEQLNNPPSQILIAGGVGYYHKNSEQILNEYSSQGEGFLSLVEQKLESVWNGSEIPYVIMRIAPLLDKSGGILKKISKSWKYLIGFYFGNSDSYFPFIYVEDFVKIVDFLILKKSKGIFNLCNKKPLTQKQIFSNLTRNKKIVFFTVPAFMIRLILGEMADETILVNQKVVPEKLLKLGFEFKIN